MLSFIDAKVNDGVLLRDTLIASKGYWGYSQEQLELWRASLKFEEDYIASSTVKLIMKNTSVIGFFAIVKSEVNELDHLWLLPAAIGKGYGSLVFAEVLAECRLQGIADFYILSDPDAEGFYLKKGACRVGEVYSDAQKRMLPKLRYSLV